MRDTNGSNGTVAASAMDAIGAYFDRLGATVEQAWALHRNSHARFPEVATQVLTDLPVPDEVNAVNLLEFLTTRRRLLPQEELGFGQPPVTLYRARDFYVSALYWLDGTTTIHQHAFSGAFRVLVGSSIHTGYGFAREEAVRGNFLLGDLQFHDAELLRKGDVRSIVAGDSFIHALFHLERPSVTIVVRTNSEHVGTPQFEYLRPGLAFDPFFKDETLSRQLFGLATLHTIAPEEALRCAHEMVSAGDLFSGFFVVRHWAKLSRGKDLDDLVEHAIGRHGSVAEIFEPVFAENKRQFNIVARRKFLHDAGHRLFLALLLNLPDRASVYRIIREVYPDQDPGRILSTWVEELSSPELRGLSGLALRSDELHSVREILETDPGDTAVRGALGSLGSSVTTTPLLEMLLS